MADTRSPGSGGESFPDPSSSVIDPLGSRDQVQVMTVLIEVRPQAPPGVVPSAPRRRGREVGDTRWGGCSPDEASEEGRERRRSSVGRQRLATGHRRLGRDREPANPCRGRQRLRAGKPRASQRRLDAHTASDARLEPASLHHHVQTAGQLDPDNLGDVPGAEEHAFERRTKVSQTPVREDRIVQHTVQYHSTGSAGSVADSPRCGRPIVVAIPLRLTQARKRGQLDPSPRRGRADVRASDVQHSSDAASSISGPRPFTGRCLVLRIRRSRPGGPATSGVARG